MEGTLTLTAAVSNHPFSWCYSVVIVQIPLDAETGLEVQLQTSQRLKKVGKRRSMTESSGHVAIFVFEDIL